MFELRACVKLEMGFMIFVLMASYEWMAPTNSTFTFQSRSWAVVQRAPECSYPLCCRASSGSLWSLNNILISLILKLYLGKCRLYAEAVVMAFFSEGTPQEVNSIYVTQTPRFLLTHHLVFVVLLPAETQYGTIAKKP